MAKPKKVLKSKSKKTLVIGSKAQLIITTSRHNIYATLVQIEQPKKVIFTLSEVRSRKLRNPSTSDSRLLQNCHKLGAKNI